MTEFIVGVLLVAAFYQAVIVRALLIRVRELEDRL
jgi:hypothetical protein